MQVPLGFAKGEVSAELASRIVDSILIQDQLIFPVFCLILAKNAVFRVFSLWKSFYFSFAKKIILIVLRQ
jgi:hypothetical protein